LRGRRIAGTGFRFDKGTNGVFTPDGELMGHAVPQWSRMRGDYYVVTIGGADHIAYTQREAANLLAHLSDEAARFDRFAEIARQVERT
jgi:hypothetical protein